MSVLETKPKFLYPHSRQFPFDEVAEKIVRAIEKRNWKVPGITIEFRTYGSGEAKYEKISSITGDNFKLCFWRSQGVLNDDWNDTAALHSVCIPKQILEVFEDESGPNYYLYVGSNWESDKEWFMNSVKWYSKQNKEPRRYLYYKDNTYKKERPKELVAYNDNDREYSPKWYEPKRINVSRKFREITEWLEKHVLKYILSFPEADVVEEPTKMEELIPYTGPWSTVFSLYDDIAAARIKKGKENPNDLPPESRHAYFGSQKILVPLCCIENNGEVPKIAYKGFIWCDVNEEEVTQNSKVSYEIRNAMKSFRDENYIVAINLKYANGVYVVDNAAYNETREALFKAISPRDMLTDEELSKALAARGATIIPITEYKGGYKEPIVLIYRELDFDEIAWLKKETEN